MPITINGNGAISGLGDIDGHDLETATLVVSGDTTIAPQAVGRATLFVDDSTNSVGINTTTPAASVLLEVADGTDPIVSLNNTGNGEVRLGCGSAEGYIGTESNDPFVLTTNGNTRLRVQAAGVIETIGRLGVQEANPEVALQVTSADFETCYLKRNNTLSATLTLLNTNDKGGFVQSRDASGGNGGLLLGNYSGGSYSEKVRIGTTPNDGYSVITEAGRGSSEQYDAGRVRINAGTCGVNVFSANNTLASQSGRPAVFAYANSVPGWASFTDSVTDATQVLQLQRNNSVNAGYNCQDQTVNFSINRWLEENNANPRTKLNITLRELGSTYSNFAFQGNGVIQLPNTGSAGIQFPAYGTGTNVNTNTLDDYEEGSFTPVIKDTNGAGGNIAPSTGVGNYIKIGGLCYITCRINNIDTSGLNDTTMFVHGMPFVSAADGYGIGAVLMAYINFNGQVDVRWLDSRTYAYFDDMVSGQLFTNLTRDDFTTTSSRIEFNIITQCP